MNLKNGPNPNQLNNQIEMERELAVEYYKFGFFTNCVVGIFALIGTLVIIFFNDSLMKVNLTALVIVSVIVCLIIMALHAAMMTSPKLRRAKPWNAIITVSLAIVVGFMIMMLSFVLKNSNPTALIWPIFALFTAWFIGIGFAHLAIAMHTKSLGERNQSCSIFCAFFVLLTPFSPFLPIYIFISLFVAQPAIEILIPVIFFVIICFLCVVFLVKRTAKKITKYLEKCDQKNQPIVYDLLYKFDFNSWIYFI